MKYENLKFNFFYLPISNFKEKHYLILQKTIGNSHLCDFMKFKCPAKITFEDSDKKHQYPIIEELDTFKRKSVNCMVYNLTHNSSNQGYYDTLFLYYDEGIKTPSYGYLLYNSKTQKMNHKFLIYGDISDLCIDLNFTFRTMYNAKIYDHFSRKYDALHNRNGKTLKDCPYSAELDKILEEMNK